jgi:predicted nucleotidyltransferase
LYCRRYIRVDEVRAPCDFLLYSRESGPSGENVRSAGEAVLSRYPQVTLAYLFGSFVTRDSFRDIDIAVRFSGKTDPCTLFDQQMKISGEIEDLLSPRVPCDVRVLNDAPVEFCFEVIRTGTILFCRSTDQKAWYEADIIRRYLDLEYLLDRVDRAYLSGVTV